MSSIDTVLGSIKPALEELQKKGISTRVGVDRDAGIIRIYGEGSDYMRRATSGLSEMLELAYTTAEHHPYWLLLYHATEVCKARAYAFNSARTSPNCVRCSNAGAGSGYVSFNACPSCATSAPRLD